MGKLLGIAHRLIPKQPMLLLEEASITLDTGVEKDLRGKPGDRQVTILAREDWEAACADTGVELSWSLRRANLLVEGLELEDTDGRQIQIGNIILEVTGESDPCGLMDKQHEGLRKALEPHWRGGATCRVLVAGTIAVGDDASWTSNEG